MGAEYLSYVKFIAIRVPTFFGYIISVLARVLEECNRQSHLSRERILEDLLKHFGHGDSFQNRL